MTTIKIRELLIFENDDFIALNKPSGLLSIPDREGREISLKVLLKEKFANILTVHRLDRDTSGILIFAKNEEAHKHFSQQFEERRTEKIYTGLVMGTPVVKKETINSPIAEHPSKKGFMTIHREGKESITDYEVLEEFGQFSWLKFRIHTGRTHQIRVHMKDIGHPLVCDELYGDDKPILLSSLKTRFKLSKKEEEERPVLKRLALHAFQLKVTDREGILHELEAPLPKDLKALLQQLRKWKK